MMVIEFDQVEKGFGSHKALRGVSFTVPAGTMFGLIGPNGSGKTTALRLMLGLLEPSAGQLRVFGDTPSERLADRIGYLPEERGLYPRMSVRDAILYYARLKGAEPSSRALDTWLDRFEIRKLQSTLVGALSKGNAQKVQFIAAVLHEPELLILDEPSSGLDPSSQEQMRRVISRYAAEGRSVILSTHDLGWAERMCQSVVMLHQGRKVLDQQARGASARDRASIKVSVAGVLPALSELPGVTGIVESDGYHRLMLGPDADPQRILAVLMQRTVLSHFELAQPSLHETFMQLATLRHGSVPPPGIGHA